VESAGMCRSLAFDTPSRFAQRLLNRRKQALAWQESARRCGSVGSTARIGAFQNVWVHLQWQPLEPHSALPLRCAWARPMWSSGIHSGHGPATTGMPVNTPHSASSGLNAVRRMRVSVGTMDEFWSVGPPLLRPDGDQSGRRAECSTARGHSRDWTPWTNGGAVVEAQAVQGEGGQQAP